jgi:hypothetical protein
VDLNDYAICPTFKPDNIDQNLLGSDQPFSSHRWHSAQFRMTMPEQKEYWKTLMKSLAYPVEYVLP